MMGIFGFQKRKEHISEVPDDEKGVRIGNGQLLGQQDYQNDYFAVIPSLEGGLLAVIANGATTKKVGRYASETAVSIMKENYLKHLHIEDYRIFFEYCFTQTEKEFIKRVKENRVAAAVLGAVIKDGIVYWGSKGDCNLYLFRRGELVWLNDRRKSKRDFGQIKLHRDDLLLLCTVGVYTSLTEMDIIYQLKQDLHPYDICMNLCEFIFNRRNKEQDNATVVLLDRLTQ